MSDLAPPARRMRRRKAADYCGVSEGFLEKAAVTGDGPPYLRLSSRLVVYDVADLDEWLAAHRVQSTAEGFERERAAALNRGKECSRRPPGCSPDLHNNSTRRRPKDNPTNAAGQTRR
jgi:hypothetical protein